MKKLLNVLLVIAVVVFGLLLAKDMLIKASVEKGVESVTGLKLNIGSLKVGIFKPVVDIKNITLRNPATYPDKNMIDVPEIYVHYDLGAIMKGTVHLPEVRLGLKEFVVVKNVKGQLNLDALKNVKMEKQDKAPQIKIDLLKLNIGKVIYKDYSKGATPEIKEFNVNINETYTNIDDPVELVNLIVVKALMRTSIARLADFDLQGLEGSVGDVLSGTQGTVKEAADKVKGLFKNPFGSAE